MCLDGLSRRIVGTAFYESCFRQAVREKITVSFEAYSPRPFDNLFEVHAYPSGDNLVVFFRDITAQRAKR